MNWLERFPRLAITLAAMVFLLPGLAQLPLVDRDEPRFSRATVEMLEGGDWVVPYFNGEYRFDKPPLTYWWMSMHYQLFGIKEYAARLHSAIATWLTALVLFSIGRRYGIDKRWAALASVIWLSSLQVMIHGRVAVADMPLILGIAICMRGLMDYIQSSKPLGWFSPAFWLCTIGSIIAFLAKGPLGLLVPLLAGLAYLAVLRKDALSKSQWQRLAKDLAPGAILFLAAIGAWGIPALLRTQGAYFDVGIGEHVVERGVSSFNDRFYIPGVYYFAIILIFFSPWVYALWPAVRQQWSQRNDDRLGLLFLGWALAPFLIFAFYKTQLPHYILPGYPALALLCANWLSKHQHQGFHLTHWINRIALGVGIGATLLVGILLVRHPQLQGMGIACFCLCALVLCLFLASEFVRKQAYCQTLGFVALASLMMIPFGLSLRSAHITVQTAEAQAGNWGATGQASAIGFSEPSLVWYSGTIWNFRSGNELEQLKLQSGDLFILSTRRWRLDDDFLNDWIQGDAPRPRHDSRDWVEQNTLPGEVTWVQGFNPGNTSWYELAIIEKQ
ncbi:ArnT family glycosyltransferase [Coraliomargarita akajimensis]|uniref:Glycosyl transferase family 39 n=1 Tax=Coraliomargarita akajimensis (strain DSM 45221 / IAM 15411 / JCM 23193 / KCTC 12865 / 04OKA010-24) TaxID=583355 RepID=D5EJZ6_CORAD|nr:glycosyltransferase family 39 protein [Coraliomargarita akajimensis]ADE54745.1 glycosyl transferase family 39 [Coraliomargarita akajimensis DSM 45221]